MYNKIEETNEKPYNTGT